MTRPILVIDDDKSVCELLELELGHHDVVVISATTPAEGLAFFERQDFGAVVIDVRMAGASGIDVCAEIIARREDVPVIVATAYADTQTAVAAIRAGAYDFVTKPFDMDELLVTLERALRHQSLREEVKRLRKAIDEAQRFDELVGASAVMAEACELVARVAQSDATVLISGESGTGKELFARAIHARSARKDGPFVAINCAALPEALLESELFGHVKGAFTDARAPRQGLFARASGGTILLDEIGEMPAGMQAKLLRVLQERTVRPVGADEEQPFDVRIVAATNREIETEVEQRRFREDLFYRINVVRIRVPPLRSRGSDVLLLARCFLERHASQSGRKVVDMTGAVAEKLLSYPWPGNVRELQNCIERAVALAPLDHIAVEDLPETIRAYSVTRIDVESDDLTVLLPMEEVERRYIMKVLAAVGGNKTAAAQILGFDRRTLYRKLEREHGPSATPNRTSGETRLHAGSADAIRKAGGST